MSARRGTRVLRHIPPRGRWREVVLDLGGVLGALCIVATVVGTALGLTPLVFRSGSMAPSIETGALALARTVPAGDLRVGDVVSVRSAQTGVRVTHRVESVAHDGARTSLTLKGDANPVADAEPYVLTSAERVFFDVSLLGYVVAWTTTPAGLLAGGLLVGLALFAGFGPGRPDQRPVRPSAATTQARLAGGLVLLVVTGAAVAPTTRSGDAPAVPEKTWAYWSDTAMLSAGPFDADTLTSPPSLTCTDFGEASVMLSWTPQDSRYAHRLTLEVEQTSVDLDETPAGTTSRVVTPDDVSAAGDGLLGSLLGSATTVAVKGRATAGTSWASTDHAPGSFVYREFPLSLQPPTLRCQ